MDEFVVGDVVYLKGHSSQLMTVVKIYIENVDVTYFDHKNHLVSTMLPIGAIVLRSPRKPELLTE